LNYWLMKSEPDVFGIDDLKARPNKTEPWDGVRNYQARNFMRDEMKVGDRILFYHSNCKPPAAVGIAEVASKPYPDPTQFDPDSKYYDPKSDPDDPRWMLVDVKYKRHLKRPIPLQEIKDHADALDGLQLIKRGNRLSVMPVSAEHFDYIVGMENV
jgi:predicted RNA-binding protein with PUA-like domain